MKKKLLFKKLALLGFPLLETEERLNVNQVLANVVIEQDLRLWEGFPLLLVNSMEKGFDSKSTLAHLKSVNDRKNFKNLVCMSLALYKHLRLKFPWLGRLFQSVLFNKDLFNSFLNQFRDGRDLKELKGLSTERVIKAFEMYFKQDSFDLNEYTTIKEEFDLEYSLSQVFSKKQKELFMKKLKGEKMTKTEREYYSRSVRKKVLALANSNLHKLAVKLIMD